MTGSRCRCPSALKRSACVRWIGTLAHGRAKSCWVSEDQSQRALTRYTPSCSVAMGLGEDDRPLSRADEGFSRCSR